MKWSFKGFFISFAICIFLLVILPGYIEFPITDWINNLSLSNKILLIVIIVILIYISIKKNNE